MSSPISIEAFALELKKIASNLFDGETRSTIAEKGREEYLKGGKLISNAHEDIALGKIAAVRHLTGTNSFDLKSKKKKDNKYQKVRDYVTTGVRGGLTGYGILGASNAMRKRPAGVDPQSLIRAAKSTRKAVALGASSAVLDRAYRHNDISLEKTSFVNPKEDGLLRTPRMELAESQQTGKFRPNIVHDSGKAFKTLQIGKRFQLPKGLI